MIINSVQLRNIRSYSEARIDFPKGSVLLAGDIGSGKSTILLAIEFALFGLLRGSLDGSALLRHGKNSGEVILDFSIEGKEVKVLRALKRNVNGIAQSAGYILVNGLKTDCSAIELKARVLELLGYPKSLLNKSKSLIYRYTVYTPQEEMKHILFEDAPERLDTLRKVFQIDKYKLVKENIAIVSRSLKEQRKLLEAETANLEEKRKELDDALERERLFAEELEKVQVEILAAAQNTSKQKEKIASIESEVEEFNEARRQISSLQSAISEKKYSLSTAIREKASVEMQIALLRKNLEGSEEAEELIAVKAGALKKAVEDLERQFQGKEKTRQAIEELETETSRMKGEIASKEALKLEAERVKSSVGKLDNCPLCMQKVSHEHKEGIAKMQKEKILYYEQEMNRMLSGKNVAEKRLNILKLALEEITRNDVVIAEATSVLERCGRVKEGYSASDVKKEIRELKELLKRFEAMATSKVLSSEKEKLAVQLSEKQEQLRKEIMEIEGTELLLQERLKGFEKKKEEHDAAKKDLIRLLEKEKDLAVRKSAVQTEIKSLKEKSAQLEKEIQRKDEAKKKIEKVMQLQQWLEEAFSGMVGVMEKQVMLRVHTEFNSFFQQWFNILLEDEAISSRLDDTFTPIVEQNGYETFVQNLSGGEKTSCALAYRLALNKVINDLITTIKTKNLLILDEPTDGFSTEQLDKVRDVIEQLNVEQLIIVSHESKIESFVQSVIRVTKESGTSRILA
ncbi:MAG: SMC family ATPase [Candidatus Woesearchaeota archaeon]